MPQKASSTNKKAGTPKLFRIALNRQPIIKLKAIGAYLALSLLLTITWNLIGHGNKAFGLTSNYPYFKTFGASDFAGGWFNNAGSCDTSSGSNYQDPSYNSNAYTGGISAFAQTDSSGNPTGGASSELGAFSLGAIEGGLYPKGFYSDGGVAATSLGGTNNKRVLTFANSTPSLSISDWGGTFQGAGSLRYSHCIPDYYSLKYPSSPPQTLPAGGIGSASPGPPGIAAGTYITPSGATPYSLTNNPVYLGYIGDTTIFSDHSVYIGNNIIQNPAQFANGITHFALVVRGSIYIGPNVTRLDGLYIAEPSPSDSTPVTTDDGIIWTCHPNSTVAYDINIPSTATTCANKLLVDGALIAKQFDLWRTGGSVTLSNTSEDTLSNALASPNIAEIINYDPDVWLGGEFFNPQPQKSLSVVSIISLPPVLH